MDREVLYVNIDADLKDEIKELAELNERSITSIATYLLRKGLGYDNKFTIILPK